MEEPAPVKPAPVVTATAPGAAKRHTDGSTVKMKIRRMEVRRSPLSPFVFELGFTSVPDENGEMVRCAKFKSDTEEHALDFLEKYDLPEPGMIAQVETPEGIFGKDEEGYFQLD